MAPWSGKTLQATSPMKYFEFVTEPDDTLVYVEKYQDAIEPVSGQPGSAQNGRFLIWRDNARGDVSSPLTVFYTVGGTAQNGSDYQTLTSPATIQAGYWYVEIEVVPYADGSEFDENVTLTLQPPPPTYATYFIKRDQGTATVMIYDPQPPFTVVVERPRGPIGIDYHPVEQALLISDHFWDFGYPWNFTKIEKVGGTVECTPWSSVAGLWDEIKLTIVKTSAANFVLGDMFFGYKPANGSTRIGRIYRRTAPPYDVVAEMNWAVLNGETSPVHGGLYVDQTGLFNRDLIVVTGGEDFEGGRVWRITSNADHSSGTKTVFVEIPNTHLEGVITLPDDQQKYGPWAGMIITGAERHDPPLIYTIDTDGNVVQFAEGIAPEDFDIIPAGQNLYCNDGNAGKIYKVPAAYFAEYVGDLLITQAGEVRDFPAALFIFHWDGNRFVRKTVLPPEGVKFEHVAFAPIDLE